MDDLFANPPPPTQTAAITVTQLLRRLKRLLETQVGTVWVEGEVSNLRKQASGHWYFSLKDEGAQIQCVMFGARRVAGSGVLGDGVKVRVLAEASVYEARGQLQVMVSRVERSGEGDLLARFEALKRKLQGEGLFDAGRKRAVPRFPRVIGLVTSGAGAALQDILNVLRRRAPWVQPVLLPVRVQGRGAEVEIAAAIGKLGNPAAYGYPSCDVIIVGRGGGSMEDLWNFNEEIVARAIAACPVPIISAVGHEVDFTIADFVADLRAPTPSAAAELAVADGGEWLERLAEQRRRLERLMRDCLSRRQLALESLRRGVLQRGGERLLREPAMRVDTLGDRLAGHAQRALEAAAMRLNKIRDSHRACQPSRVCARRLEELTRTGQRLQRAVATNLSRRDDRVGRLAGLLRTLGPVSAFQRGFSITLGADGRIVKSAQALRPGDLLRTKFADGEATSRVL